MTKEKGRQWDGRSRIPTDQYKKNFDDIFKKKNVITEKEWEQKFSKKKTEEKENKEYLKELKKKL